MSKNDDHQPSNLSSILTRALSYPVLEAFRRCDADLNILSSLYALLEKTFALEETELNDPALSPRGSGIQPGIYECNLKRNELIDRFDETFRKQCPPGAKIWQYLRLNTASC